MAVALAAVALALAVEVAPYPEPKAAIVVDRASFGAGDRPAEQVSLPHLSHARRLNTPVAQYVVEVDAPPIPDGGLFVLIPHHNRRLLVESGGNTLGDSSFHALFFGPTVTMTTLVRLPAASVATGRITLTLTFEIGRFVPPGYLSKIYIGSEAELAPTHKWQSLFDYVKIVGFALQVLLATGLVIAFFFNPRSSMLFWFALLEVVSIVFGFGMLAGYMPVIRNVLPYVSTLIPAFSLMLVAVPLVLIEIEPPKAMSYSMVAITLILIVCTAMDTEASRAIVAIAGIVFMCVGTLVAMGIVAWAALRRDNVDAFLMLGPAILIAWTVGHDTYIVATLPDNGFALLSPHSRLAYVLGLIAVLMRRMSASFDQLDRSNEVLNAKLAEREAELAAIARHEQAEATRLTREQERQRLTHDLHDGLSGHLASIIALSERADAKPIEAAAREALNDLRLVIYSLDLGERDLPLALANFRERLAPQLQRLGVELDWSMADLPEVSGVTPGNALMVLRILQEAITNALRHGPARRIAVRGSASAGDLASITIENDGKPFVAGGGGRGLDNMRRRAEQLHARLETAALDGGSLVTLLLPLRLADVEA